MSFKKPIVMGSDGNFQQIQPGDQLQADVATTATRQLTNGEVATAMPPGTPVYISAASTVKRAQANAAATAKVCGLVYDAAGIAAGASGGVAVADVLPLTTAQWDAVTGQVGGLTPGADYFLDPANVGKLTTTPPSTVGQLVVKIGSALSTTDMEISIRAPVLL